MTIISHLTHRRTISLATGVLLIAFVLALGGCGKKPRTVDPPQGSEADRFPQTYPNPATDPAPGKTGSGLSFP
ncbi:hypothetical protein M2352_002716 [Azospirillum fermentarium]|uniref:hypothetical protein n=1 Tax=Azospirillum fermentarium TaxID=1233114 RepID=UPI0022261C46|nr:hypothetical protein [Azospirillum fermentarium]MCW2247125.1 hypothetical protein [Azospirillum fermentarium]